MVNPILNGKRALDIGSNAGFVSIHIATLANEVIGVELNPYLNRIARDAAAYLGVSNVEFVEKDFRDYWCAEPFDAIMSLSNHHTIDGNFYMPFEAYISKISGLLKESGYLLFESHNVFAEGKGGVGDDGDMEEKIAIMSRYFQIERYKMVRCYLEHGVDDLDKLFIVARKSSNPSLETFCLEEARTRYEYSQ